MAMNNPHAIVKGCALTVGLSCLTLQAAWVRAAAPDNYGHTSRAITVVQDPNAIRIFQPDPDPSAPGNLALGKDAVVAVDQARTNPYHKNLYRIRFIHGSGCATGWADANDILTYNTDIPSKLPPAVPDILQRCYGQGASNSSRGESLDGVRLGMTKSDAALALRQSRSGGPVEELYASYADMYGYHLTPKKNFRPADDGIFAALSAGAPETATCSYGQRAAPITRTLVLFTANLKDPRVAYIEKHIRHCHDSTPVRTAIADLLTQFGSAISRSDNVDLNTKQLSGQASYMGAFLEWRSGSRGRQTLLMGAKRDMNISNLPMDLGNPGGGSVVHVNIVSEPSDMHYLGSLDEYLWDDEEMVDVYKDHMAILAKMQRLGYGVGDLGNQKVIEEINIVHERPKVAAVRASDYGTDLAMSPFEADSVLTADLWILKSGEKLQYVRPFIDPMKPKNPPSSSVLKRDLTLHPEAQSSNPLVIVPDTKWRRL